MDFGLIGVRVLVGIDHYIGDAECHAKSEVHQAKAEHGDRTPMLKNQNDRGDAKAEFLKNGG